MVSYGGKTSKRACLHELYLIQGDLREENISVSGYPVLLDNASTRYGICEYYVALPKELKGESVFYRVSDDTGRVSNEVEVTGEPLPESNPSITTRQKEKTEKVIREGQVYIQHRTGEYTILGQKKR